MCLALRNRAGGAAQRACGRQAYGIGQFKSSSVTTSGSKPVRLPVSRRQLAATLLPKGWPMDGKSPLEAAQIEAREEAGVESEVSDSAIGSFRYIKLFGHGTSAPAQALVHRSA